MSFTKIIKNKINDLQIYFKCFNPDYTLTITSINDNFDDRKRDEVIKLSIFSDYFKSLDNKVKRSIQLVNSVIPLIGSVFSIGVINELSPMPNLPEIYTLTLIKSDILIDLYNIRINFSDIETDKINKILEINSIKDTDKRELEIQEFVQYNLITFYKVFLSKMTFLDPELIPRGIAITDLFVKTPENETPLIKSHHPKIDHPYINKIYWTLDNEVQIPVLKLWKNSSKFISSLYDGLLTHGEKHIKQQIAIDFRLMFDLIANMLSKEHLPSMKTNALFKE